MRLRPHHLLCTQSYVGKGYNGDFVENMTAVVNYLRNDTNAEIEIVFSTDDICAKCPKMIGVDLCESNDKVKRIDSKVTEYFNLEEKHYVYREIIHGINAKITELIMEDICHECNWYSVSDCKKKIIVV